jgi:hypothetical protein
VTVAVPKVAVDRQLLHSALEDAIVHQQQVMAQHNGYLSSGEPGDRPHCQPGSRCGPFYEAARKLQTYKTELDNLHPAAPSRPYRVTYRLDPALSHKSSSHHASEDSAAEKYGFLRRTGIPATVLEWRAGLWARISRDELRKRGYGYVFDAQEGDQDRLERMRPVPF